MSACSACSREMLAAPSCAVSTLELQGQTYDRIPYGQDGYGELVPDRCNDCGVTRGGVHHPPCDLEQCPRCHGQAIACGATVTGECRE